jgi:hypothetical protein
MLCSFAVFYKNRLWRTEVEAKKRQRLLERKAKQDMEVG